MFQFLFLAERLIDEINDAQLRDDMFTEIYVHGFESRLMWIELEEVKELDGFAQIT